MRSWGSLMNEEQLGGTLDELAATRGAAEDDYLAHVRELERRVAGVLEAAAEAEDGARQSEAGAAPESSPVSLPQPLELPKPDRQQADQPPWPVGGGGLRGVLNGFARWWLRDYLAVLDARHEALAERSRHLETDLDDAVAALVDHQVKLLASCTQLNQALTDLRGWGRSAWSEHRSRTELLRHALNRIGEAIDLVSGASLRLRALMNAKDAETVQRVVGGVDRKAEIVLDALARRQEALLAELVGRRQELDEILAAARRSG